MGKGGLVSGKSIWVKTGRWRETVGGPYADGRGRDETPRSTAVQKEVPRHQETAWRLSGERQRSKKE